MATIEGNVVRDGQLVTGATVKALDEDGNELATTTTSSEGTYSLSATLPCFVGALYDDGGTLYVSEHGFLYVD